MRLEVLMLGLASLSSGAFCAYAQTLSFLPEQYVSIGPGCCALVTGDFNRDGKPDLVVGYGTGALAILLGDGAGGFKPPAIITTIGGGFYFYRLFAADVNRDGKLDLLIEGSPLVPPGSAMYIFLGRGDGTFQIPSQPTQVGALFVGDLNGDGKPDLLSPGGSVYVYLGNGDGTFQKPVVSAEAFDTMSDRIAVGDFNGDGIPDFAWSNVRSSGRIGVYLGNGDGTFRIASIFSGCPGPNRPLAVGDLNHDGKLDLVSGGPSYFSQGGCTSVFFGKGDGTFQDALVISSDLQAGFTDNSMFVADFNRDGKLDIVHDNVVILGNGDGTFQPPAYFLTVSSAASCQAVADLNGDGSPDLIYVDYVNVPYPLPSDAHDLSILLNDTPAPPTSVIGHSAATVAGPVAPSSIATVYGKNLAHTTVSATGSAPPTQLGGIMLQVRDTTNPSYRLAPLLYVSPTQINFIVPDQTAPGPVVLTLNDGSYPLIQTANATAVTQIAAAIFTANGQGKGAAAATAVRILADGTQQPVTVFNCSVPGQCATVPIDLTGGQGVYLTLYGTGFRAAPTPTCNVGGIQAVVQFAGAQPTIPGLDQINILLPATLPSGIAYVQCQFYIPTVPRQSMSNPVQIEIR